MERNLIENAKSAQSAGTVSTLLLATVASLMVFSLYSIVDGLFVAKGVGDYAMAAVNLAVPFTNVMFSIAVTFAVGTSTILSIYLGQGNREHANRLFSQNLVLLAIIGLTITALVLVFLEPFALLLGAEEGNAGLHHVVSAGAGSLCHLLHRVV